MGEKPDYQGEINTYNDDKIGTIAIWKNKKDNKKQPNYTGTLSFRNGKKKFKIALWKNEAEEEKQKPKEKIPEFA